MKTVRKRRIEFWRAQDLGDRWESPGRLSAQPDVREIREVLLAAQKILRFDTKDLFEDGIDFATAEAALSSVSQFASLALHGHHSSAIALTEANDMLDILDWVRAAEKRLTRPLPRRQNTAFETAQNALAGLEDSHSVKELRDRVLQSVCELGFDRAIMSSVRRGLWVTEAMCIPDDPQWALEIASIGQRPPEQLNSAIYESEIIRRKTPITVLDAQRSQHVHRRIAEASLARSYVAAPIMSKSEVIGFLHADCYFQRRHVDQFDQQVLSIFAIGFGYLLQRNSLADRIRSLQSDISVINRRLSLNLNEAIGPQSLSFSNANERGGAEVDSIVRGSNGASTFAAEANYPLTQRELVVLRLIADGATNSRIANQLLISEGTVKSHVKRILRKLGAANRTEAVSLFLQ